MFQTSLSLNDVMFLLQGAGVTLLITFWAMLGGTILGIIFGVFRATTPWWATAPLAFVLDIFRSVPLLIQLVLVNAFQAIAGLNISAFVVSCIVLALYTSAYCSELVRGGIAAVPVTTRRAARSLGMTWWQDMTQIVYPIALRIMLPSWIGLTLGVMKDTALVSWLGIIELLRSSQIIVTRIQEPLFVLTVAGLIYFIISFPISRLGARLERKWREND
ncbi:amino acid ABC transporter [Devosia limi DSM 17137]|uniref:Amino acid ABC transporter n=1 Tax=Devosia limi DSM 17137 TaxID=1121477 RepID=A0A0F5LEK4_9HYPH|nr:amino acid ABC transporter permease [Devosia limi]KKB80624.1 amino acid ABC transporter [Devosia limi DSM 17137]SHE50528.1 polar amino acid transport system permease protein [Devosia limi DSM 17137]